MKEFIIKIILCFFLGVVIAVAAVAFLKLGHELPEVPKA